MKMSPFLFYMVAQSPEQGNCGDASACSPSAGLGPTAGQCGAVRWTQQSLVCMPRGRVLGLSRHVSFYWHLFQSTL